jgi:hypothetical protein
MCRLASPLSPNRCRRANQRAFSLTFFFFFFLVRQLSEYLVNFQAVIPEITLAPSSAGLLLKSFMSNQSVAADSAGTRALYTNMDLPASIFADYRVPFADAMELTVTLREFKAFVQFGDVVARPIVIKFTASGQPISLSMTGQTGFQADMMLATVSNADEDATMSAATAAATAAAAAKTIKKQPAPVEKKAERAPPAGANNADDDNSSSYYYSYDTSRTDVPQPPQPLPALKQEKGAKGTAAAAATAAAAVAAATVTSAASSSAIAAAKAGAAAARTRENANNARAAEMVVDNTELPSETTATGANARHPMVLDDEPLDFPPSPSHSPLIPVGALYRDPSPEI